MTATKRTQQLHGVSNEPRNSRIAGAETVRKVERNMSSAVMRGTATLPAKGNACQQSTCRAQDRVSVSQALERIRQAAAAAWRYAPEVGAVCINVHVRICAGGGE